MHKLIAAIVLVVAGCAAPAPTEVTTYRKMAAPIWSNAQLDAGRMVGSWRQTAAFGPQAGGCGAGTAEIGGAAGRLTLDASLCLGGRQMRLAGPLTAAGPGRFIAGDQEWWVIWVDTDFRTLAIGTPNGAFGFILNRGGALPPDRLRAAREIFDFNGYDVARLRAF